VTEWGGNGRKGGEEMREGLDVEEEGEGWRGVARRVEAGERREGIEVVVWAGSVDVNLPYPCLKR